MTDSADRAAAKIEEVNVSRWPDRKLPMMTARIGNEHMVLARFLSDDKADLFMALVRRGMAVSND